MTTFNIIIEDTKHLAGISAARAAYNQSIPLTIINDDNEEIENPDIIQTDADYVQFVMTRAADSYSKQYNT